MRSVPRGFIEHFQHLRKRHERLHTRIPGLLLERVSQLPALERRVARLLNPAIGFDDFQRIGRRHQHLGDERIRIERDRREHLTGLLCRQRRGGLRRRLDIALTMHAR